MYARATGAVPSGRSVSERPPWSSKANISFWTLSVVSPTPRANSSAASKAGVSTYPYPARANRSSQVCSRARRGPASSGRTSNVPRGAVIFAATCLAPAQLGEERIGRALRAEGRQAHVAGQDPGLLRQRLHQRADRLEQRRPVAARQVRSPDRAL